VARLIRNKFLSGLIILVPIAITGQALYWLFVKIDDLARTPAMALIGHDFPGSGFAMSVIVVLVTGLLFSAGPLKWLLDSFEDVIEHVPLIGVVYGTIKKVFQGFGSATKREAFKRFVLARLRGRTTPGFLTGSFVLRHADGRTESLCTIYVPTNHLYVGDIVVLPAEDVIETDLSIEDGISVILSAGASIPASVGAVRSDAPVSRIGP
jgi:uncharacterized membrane protein